MADNAAYRTATTLSSVMYMMFIIYIFIFYVASISCSALQRRFESPW